MTIYSKFILSLIFAILFVLVNITPVHADQVTNVRYYRISDDEIVIYYDLESDSPADISLAVSLPGGSRFALRPSALDGDAGRDVLPGQNRRIIWKLPADAEELPEGFIIEVVIGDGSVTPVSHPESDGDSRIEAVPTLKPVKLDGLLNEPAWKSIEPVSDFTQRELTEGAAPTEKTEVRIMYDDENLYFGVICFDSNPEGIIHRELKWDGGGVSGQQSFTPVDDMFTLVIDTYNDKRTAHYFAVNPNGAQYDASFQSGDYRLNFNWNGIWEVRSHIADYGWSCEIAIPFKTLRFPATETQTWAINFMRNIRRKNEEVLWRGWRRNEGIRRLANTGTLIIGEQLETGYKMDVTPYVLTGVEKEPDEDRNSVLKYGIDVKYGITSNTTLDLTTHTDFAQIEDDREQINLTRFSLRYPEKRDFFLEGAETFTFTLGREELFYSRRIGITEDNEMLPILGGAKLTQKSGSYRVGMMTMQTEEKHGVPSANYSVVRVKKDVLEQSYIGFLGTSVYNTNKHDNKLYGLDFEYKTSTMFGGSNLEVNGILAGTVTDGEKEDATAKRLSIYFPNDLLYLYAAYSDIGENFNPELGYLRRTGVKNYFGFFRISPRSNIPHIKKFVFEPFFTSFYTDMSGKLLTRDWRIQPFGIEFNSDNRLEFTLTSNYEYLDEDFDIFDDVIIPIGEYDWWSYGIEYISSKSKPVAVALKTEWGDFYNGDRSIVELECILKTNMYYSLSADVKYNNISVVGRDFETREYGGRVVVDFSTRLSSSTFVQWNNETNEVNVNFRFRYTPKIGSDVYLVYNRLMDEENNFRSLYDTGMLKVDYTYRF